MGEKSHPLMDLHSRGQNIYQVSSEMHFSSRLAVRGMIFLDKGFIGMPGLDDTEGLSCVVAPIISQPGNKLRLKPSLVKMVTW